VSDEKEGGEGMDPEVCMVWIELGGGGGVEGDERDRLKI